MNKNNFTKTSKEITCLKELVEKTSGIVARTPSDFKNLADIIRNKTNESLSPTTLKRIWGYIDEAVSIRHSTLNILSQFSGYRNWEDFTSHFSENLYEVVKTIDLKEGNHLIVCWEPNRRIKIKYDLGNTFTIEEQENTIFQIGDTFKSEFFILHEPLNINEFKHGNNSPISCVFASGGITSIKNSKY